MRFSVLPCRVIKRSSIATKSSIWRTALLTTLAASSNITAAAAAMTTTPSSTSTTTTATTRGIAFAALLPPLPAFHKRLIVVRHGQTDWNAKGLMQGGGFDIALNEEGHEQAQRVADELSGLTTSAGGETSSPSSSSSLSSPLLRVIASSHLQRALQTAHYIHTSTDSDNDTDNDSNNNNLHHHKVVDPRFGEMRFGDFEGTVIHGPEATADHMAHFKEMQQKMSSDITLAWPSTGTSTGSSDDDNNEKKNVAESTLDVSKRAAAGISNLLDQHADESHFCVVAHGRFNKVLLATLLYNDPSRFAELEQGNTCINVLDWNTGDDDSDDGGGWKAVVLNYTDHAPTANAKVALNNTSKGTTTVAKT